jgi:hypothetical protein
VIVETQIPTCQSDQIVSWQLSPDVSCIRYFLRSALFHAQ